MGHLTRQLAVALAGRPQARSTLFSLSLGLPAVIGEVPGEYCPGADREWVRSPHWHSYLTERVVALAQETHADVLLFDGVAPYPGLLKARPRLRNVQFTWMRRGLWRPDMNTDQLNKAAVFDSIIEPGDLAGAADRGATAGRSDAIKVAPVSMLEVVEPLSRREAAAELGIDPDRATVLVTLGSGRLGDITAPGTVVLRTLLEDRGWQICLTKASIALHGVPVVDPERIIQLEGVYPLVKYLNAFDAVVSATGYNAVHEFVPAGLPTLFVPNPVTFTDDQEARAMWLRDNGLALSVRAEESEQLAALTRSLSQQSLREELSANCRSLPDEVRLGGARQTADLLIGFERDFVPAGTWIGEATRLANEAMRRGAKQLLGPQVTNRVRRALGRPTYDSADQRTLVRLVDSAPPSIDDPPPLYVGEDVTAQQVREGTLVEHLLAGASGRYRARRLKIIERFYNVQAR